MTRFRIFSTACVIAAVMLGAMPAQAQTPMDIGDIIHGIKLLFPGFNLLDRTPATPPCGTAEGNFAVLNVNGDGSINISDIIYMANCLFMSGPPPVQGYECFSVDKALLCPDDAACE